MNLLQLRLLVVGLAQTWTLKATRIVPIALKLRNVKTAPGFKILFEDCKPMFVSKQADEKASIQSNYAMNIRDVKEHGSKFWQILSN